MLRRFTVALRPRVAAPLFENGFVSELTQNDVQKLLEIIDKMDGRDVHLEIGELKLHVSRSGNAPLATTAAPPQAKPAPPPGPAPAPAAPPETSAEFEVPPGHVAVRAPTKGVFYRAASPDAKPFVEVGDHVGPEDTVCVLEVMKLFSSLRAEIAGTVTAIPLANETLVEQDQPLIVIRPD